MFCSFCKNSTTKLATHFVCDCCMVHLECCEATAENQLATHIKLIVPDEDEVDMGECDICLQEYPEDELEEHRKTCTAQLVFQCTVCDGDYVSKEGLWNHLDLHEIAEEGKDLHYREIRATYNLHKCILCNDQRGYQESLYWQHVHEDHDGFFLRCVECRENFRSEKLKNHHDLNHCKVREKIAPLDSSGPERNHEFINVIFPVQVETTAIVTCGETNKHVAQLELLQRNQSDQQVTPMKNVLESDMNIPVHMKCDKCNRRFQKLSTYNYHQLTSHSDPQHQCPHCSKKFHLKDTLLRHLSEHAKEQCAAESEPLSVETSEGYCASSISVDNDEPGKKNESFPISSKKRKVKTKARNDEPVKKIQAFPISSKKRKDKTKARDDESVKKIEAFPISSKKGKDKTKAAAEEISQLHDKSSLVTFNKKCPDCDKECLGKKSLIRHIYWCHKLIKCSTCGATIAGQKQVWYHKLTNHTEPKYKCRTCPKKFHLKSVYQRHLSKHFVGRKFSCDICHQSYKNLYSVNFHKNKFHHVKNIQADHTASKVDQEQVVHVVDGANNETGENESDIPRSYSRKRHNNRRTVAEEMYQPLDKNPPSGLSDTVCPHCHKEFHLKNNLTLHIIAFHQLVMCDICGTMVAGKNQFKYHKLTNHTEPKHKCPHCSTMFHKKSSYQRHLSKHLQDNRIPCKLCGSKFINLESVRNHTRRFHHNVQTDFTDSNELDTEELQDEKIAAKEEMLVEETSLLQHKNQIPDEDSETTAHHIKPEILETEISNVSAIPSSAESPQVCQLFSGRNEVNDHQEPLKCLICGLNFETAFRLRCHRLTSHTKPRYKCSRCPRLFHVKHLLQRHEMRHSQTGENEHLEPIFKDERRKKCASKVTNQSNAVVCEHCNKTVANAFSLQRHIYHAHSSIQVKCGICDLKFSSQPKLYYHKLNTHTKPSHKCPHCDKKFHVKYRLQEHLAIHFKATKKHKSNASEGHPEGQTLIVEEEK